MSAKVVVAPKLSLEDGQENKVHRSDITATVEARNRAVKPMNRSSRRQEALTFFIENRVSLLTSAATGCV